MIHSFFSFIFYALGILAILWEGLILTRPKRAVSFIKDCKGKDWRHYDETHRSLSVLMILYTFWVIVGIFTSQWIAFLLLLVVSAIPKGSWWIIRALDAFVSIVLLVFIILNKYHFHIDLWQLILNKI